MVKVPIPEIGESGKTATPTDALERILSGQLTIWYPPKPAFRHWRRAKIGRRFCLFFRFDSKSRIIIFAWVNDETALRKAGSATDPYAMFQKMLEHGNPPNDWRDLLSAAGTAYGPKTRSRMARKLDPPNPKFNQGLHLRPKRRDLRVGECPGNSTDQTGDAKIVDTAHTSGAPAVHD